MADDVLDFVVLPVPAAPITLSKMVVVPETLVNLGT